MNSINIQTNDFTLQLDRNLRLKGYKRIVLNCNFRGSRDLLGHYRFHLSEMSSVFNDKNFTRLLFDFDSPVKGIKYYSEGHISVDCLVSALRYKNFMRYINLRPISTESAYTPEEFTKLLLMLIPSHLKRQFINFHETVMKDIHYERFQSLC